MKQYLQLAVPLFIAAACTSGDRPGLTSPELGLAAARPINAASISVTSLPSLGGSSTARAINDDQVIVGSSNGLPVTWTLVSGVWKVTPLQNTSGAADDITETGGVIVGSSGGSVILWAPGVAPEIVGPGFAVAINEARVIVGQAPPGADGNSARAWTWSGTAWEVHILPRQAGVTDGFTEVRDINDDGVIVGGGGSVAGGGTHAIKWVPDGAGEWSPAVPLDEVARTYLGGASAIVGDDIVGVNLRCTVAPCARDPYHWSLTGQGVGSLGSQDAWAEGLNAQRSIVGTFLYRGSHAFVWTTVNPIIRDLGAPNGYQGANAYDINSPKGIRTASQAVGEAISNSGKRAAVLWTIP